MQGPLKGIQRSLMKNIVDASHRFPACIYVSDIAMDEAETPPVLIAHLSHHFIQIVLGTGREIIQSGYRLTKFQQRLDQIGPNETGATGDEPFPGMLCKLLLNSIEAVHDGIFHMHGRWHHRYIVMDGERHPVSATSDSFTVFPNGMLECRSFRSLRARYRPWITGYLP
jgi:hypothetical protein